jgi:two-component system chemotaxis response regulator CheY
MFLEIQMSDLYKKKIIIVEDSEFSRLLIDVKLKNAGFTNTHLPSSSVEAWEQIAQAQLSDHPFDLVISDLNMPDLDGMDLLSKIKDDPMSEKLKVIIVSADADKPIQNIALSLGASAYVTKPFVPEELIKVVKAVLQGEEIPPIKGMFPAS